jgi:glycosyltransferase involved in cell wall biosynthesis
MNIGLIVDPYGEKAPGGLGRAIFEMAKSIVESKPEHSYTLYMKDAPKTRPDIKGEWQLKKIGARSLFFTAARAVDRTHDVHVFFNPIIPLFFFPKKSIVVVHDFAYLELGGRTFKEKLTRLVLYFAHGTSLHKASAVVAVSQAAKDSTIKHFHIDPKKIRVIYNGFIASSSAPKAVDVPPKFFLFAGVLKERKNVHGIIHAFAEFHRKHQDFHLLIAGKREGAYAKEAVRLAEGLGLETQVWFLGYVTDAELAYLYTKAVALVFPSFIEGFGMPVLEAMHAGLPVITSNTGALAEVAGDAALLVDPHNPTDIAHAMEDILTVRETYMQKGHARAQEFSWQKTASAFHEQIASL